ncbi:acetyltransferase [Intrasporangium oryzae NRRL B-24470]|uniref:Acetyltransferase n=1 Tax=Intrasporangium oryzae NRRL B-24470 TaxID=1386089 RepID=W9GAP9_9MICO|nr:ACT domain-containing protein [Intrasporangium oryzae]EWT03266.1 acetyltransferase [Intrasporangium oryzae NRRL B-24470]
MTGITDLDQLLASLEPELHPEPWVVAVVERVPDDCTPFATVDEDEGTTVVVTAAEADRLGLAHDYVAARITLRVHSALEAVGMTAAFSRALADAGMSCNVIAGFHHDHLLVPWERGAEAVTILRSLGRGPDV